MTRRRKSSKPEELPRRDANGKAICGAKTKRKGGVCPNPPMENGRCYHHGGMSLPPGPSHPTYKHGRLSKYLPPEVAARLAEVKADPDALSIRENAAIVSVRKSQLAERLATGESGETWKLLRKKWGEFKLGNRLIQEATANEDAAAREEAREMVTSALESVEKLINSGASDETRWDEFLAINQDEAGLIAMEVARQHRMAEMMSMEQALLLVSQVTDAVMTVVKDQQQRFEIGRLLHGILQNGVAPAAREIEPAIESPALPPAVETEAKNEQPQTETQDAISPPPRDEQPGIE